MSHKPQSISSFRAYSTRQQRAGKKEPVKRQRPTLVCDHCKASKLRCDRNRPCSRCVRRDGGTSCSYNGLLRARGQPAIEERLQHLEAKVIQLLDATDPSEPVHSSRLPSDSTGKQAHVFSGRELGLSKNQFPTVVEEIMESIHQLRLELPTTVDESDLEESIADGNDVVSKSILGLPSASSKGAILSQYMPLQKDADHLLETYFGSGTFVQPFIHTRQFQREYHTFKIEHFQAASAFWLSTLFSIFSIAALVHEAAGGEKIAQTPSCKFYNAAGKLLALGDYHDTQRDAPEALLLYAHCKSLKSLDPTRECGAIISMAVRHAYELGYHRDPDTFGRFTVFEGEMRRRFWACCKQVDTMVSFQLGLPNNIILQNCDTKSPSNLLDSDFDFDTQILPQARPESEATPILWFIVKDRLMPVFSRICQAALSLRVKSDIEIMELETEARKAYATIPNILQWRSVSESISDPPFLVMCRFFLELLFLKSLCILHLKNMVRANAHSIVQCTQAASSIVKNVADIHCGLRPGGHLQAVSWMFNNFVMTDFLLGGSTLCLYINLYHRGSISQGSMMITLEEILLLLKTAHSICVDRSLFSIDARKLGRAINLTLESADANLSAFIPPTVGSATGCQPQTTTKTTVPGIPDWPVDTTNHNTYSEDQFTFSTLDPFDFISNGLIDIEQFCDTTTSANDFKIL